MQRTAKFVKHLPDFGYEAVVIAGPAETSLAWAPKDATLASDVQGTRVIRLPGPEPSWSRGWLGRSERWLGRRSRFSRWWVSGTTALGREHARDADVIYATMSPFETADAAMRLAHADGYALGGGPSGSMGARRLGRLSDGAPPAPRRASNAPSVGPGGCGCAQLPGGHPKRARPLPRASLASCGDDSRTGGLRRTSSRRSPRATMPRSVSSTSATHTSMRESSTVRRGFDAAFSEAPHQGSMCSLASHLSPARRRRCPGRRGSEPPRSARGPPGGRSRTPVTHELRDIHSSGSTVTLRIPTPLRSCGLPTSSSCPCKTSPRDESAYRAREDVRVPRGSQADPRRAARR